MTAKKTAAVTATNIRSGKEVSVPAPGKIVSLTYDVADTSHRSCATDAKWSRSTVIGIVMGHATSWDTLGRAGQSPVLSILCLDGKKRDVFFSRIAKSSATRSVSPEARKALASIYNWETRDAAKWNEKMKRLKEQMEAARKASGAADAAATLAAATGSLTEQEFARAVSRELSSKLPSFGNDGWEVTFWDRRLAVRREVEIEKYYNGAMSYLEYDDCRSLVSDAINTAEGKRISAKYRRELPLREKLDEGFSLEDKNWLVYCEGYVIAERVDDMLLTECLAKELVAKAVKKTR